MKKTVAFNEGFEILFGIIDKEGGSSEVGYVIQDCLQIVNNILHGSETCQRLFFSMGAAWIKRLASLFDPQLLEAFRDTATLDDSMDGDAAATRDADGALWFGDQSRVACAVLAINALNSSLGTLSAKHQAAVLGSKSRVVGFCVHWITRRGPTDLAHASLSLLCQLARENEKGAAALASFTFAVTPSERGKTIPSACESNALQFRCQPRPQDPRRLSSLLSLLAELYVFPDKGLWDSAAALAVKTALDVDFDVLHALLTGRPDAGRGLSGGIRAGADGGRHQLGPAHAVCHRAAAARGRRRRRP
jgi:hypothetical protein